MIFLWFREIFLVSFLQGIIFEIHFLCRNMYLRWSVLLVILYSLCQFFLFTNVSLGVDFFITVKVWLIKMKWNEVKWNEMVDKPNPNPNPNPEPYFHGYEKVKTVSLVLIRINLNFIYYENQQKKFSNFGNCKPGRSIKPKLIPTTFCSHFSRK